MMMGKWWQMVANGGLVTENDDGQMAANGGLMTENEDGQMVVNGGEWWAHD
jgi:hypothetical protein